MSINGHSMFLCASKDDIDYCSRFYNKAIELSHLFDGNKENFRKLIRNNI
jgi:hypothetical protein